ncbi:hypothetical protein XENOCAPTIV_013233 [Xenoophorus captivus]|uniref:Uncharacterized protein n=1 Tax=Xenoophorus captivus TaxID=1517983 RepID=A0ABV0Q5W9_9TELE
MASTPVGGTAHPQQIWNDSTKIFSLAVSSGWSGHHLWIPTSFLSLSVLQSACTQVMTWRKKYLQGKSLHTWLRCLSAICGSGRLMNTDWLC